MSNPDISQDFYCGDAVWSNGCFGRISLKYPPSRLAHRSKCPERRMAFE